MRGREKLREDSVLNSLPEPLPRARSLRSLTKVILMERISEEKIQMLRLLLEKNEKRFVAKFFK